MADISQSSIPSSIPLLSDEQQAQVSGAYVRESIARAALVETNLDIARRTHASLTPSTTKLSTPYKDAIKKFKSWRQEHDSTDTLHQYLDLESLNLYLYCNELESLCTQLNGCTDNDSMEKVENLVRILRATMKESGQYLSQT
jgi:hypothetical protein